MLYISNKKSIFDALNALKNIQRDLALIDIEKTMNNAQIMHNNHRTELKKAMLEGFAISSVVKKGIEEDTLLNDKEAIEELKSILVILLGNQLMLTAEIYRLLKDEPNGNDKKAE